MMKKITQTEIARRCKISSAHLSMIITCERRPSWKVAKRLAETTGTSPQLWLDGSTKQIAEFIAKLKGKNVK